MINPERLDLIEFLAAGKTGGRWDRDRLDLGA